MLVACREKKINAKHFFFCISPEKMMLTGDVKGLQL